MFSVWSLVFYSLILLSVAAAAFAALRDPGWYWAAGLMTYFAGFLGSWSIGLYLLSATFALLALAVAHSLSLVRNVWHSIAAIGIGLVVWYVAVNVIDDYWLFLPFHPFFAGGA